MKLKKGDHVRVIAGKDVGKEGDITRVYPEADKRDRGRRQRREAPHPRDRARPCRAASSTRTCRCTSRTSRSSAARCDKPTRVGYRFEDDGTKVRICRKCGKDL